MLGKIRSKILAVKSHLYKWRFCLTEASRHRELSVAAGTRFFVSVVGGGTGSIRIESDVKFGYYQSHRLGNGAITLQARGPGARITIGRNSFINNNSVICATDSIQVGQNCLIGDLVAIYDSDFHAIDPNLRHVSCGLSKPVRIGDNVWIGSRSMILKGVEIGDNSVIGAMSLVTRSIPPNCVAAGNPARVIRTIDTQIPSQGPVLAIDER